MSTKQMTLSGLVRETLYESLDGGCCRWMAVKWLRNCQDTKRSTQRYEVSNIITRECSETFTVLEDTRLVRIDPVCMSVPARLCMVCVGALKCGAAVSCNENEVPVSQEYDGAIKCTRQSVKDRDVHDSISPFHRAS